jgi:hypothetical protein
MIASTIHEQDAGDDLWDQFESLKAVPVFWGLQAGLKDRDQRGKFVHRNPRCV